MVPTSEPASKSPVPQAPKDTNAILKSAAKELTKYDDDQRSDRSDRSSNSNRRGEKRSGRSGRSRSPNEQRKPSFGESRMVVEIDDPPRYPANPAKAKAAPEETPRVATT